MDRRNYLKASSGAFAALALSGCVNTITGSNGDKIVIGSDIPYPPFEYEKKDGTLTGFDPAIAEAIFKEQLDMDYEFQKASFEGIIGNLNSGSFRIIMSAMTINKKRKKSVDFSDPYFTAYQTVAIRKDSNIKKLEDLKGNTVAVQKGTTGETAAEDLKKEWSGNLNIDSFDQITGAFNALKNKQASAVINDNTVSAKSVQQNDNFVFLKGDGAAAEQGKNAPDYLTLTVEEYGIAFRKDDDDLRKKVNKALKTIKDDGTYDEIYNQYFDA
jgi:polar amino acid transport system substrate-binding protein